MFRMRPRSRYGSHQSAVGVLLAIVVSGFVVAACGSGGGSGGGNATGQDRSTSEVNQDGTTSIRDGALQTQLDAMPKSSLSPSDVAGLAHMREEEKLAHDVYSVLADKWGVKVFSNISSAEVTHTNAVKALLDRYGLADPAAGKAVGEFTDPQIQALYDDLVAQGSRSVVDALTVGATIEDLDIADLQARATSAQDVQLVYDNLEKGSRNHLRAFVKQLERNNATYTPTHISPAEYEAIVNSGVERGTR